MTLAEREEAVLRLLQGEPAGAMGAGLGVQARALRGWVRVFHEWEAAPGKRLAASTRRGPRRCALRPPRGG